MCFISDCIRWLNAAWVTTKTNIYLKTKTYFAVHSTKSFEWFLNIAIRDVSRLQCAGMDVKHKTTLTILFPEALIFAR